MKPPLPGPRYFNPFWLVRSLSNPTDFMLRARERYGDTYRLPTVLGPVVVTGDPEGVRAIFSADADTFVPYRPVHRRRLCALRNEDRAGHDSALSPPPAAQRREGLAGAPGGDDGALGRDPDDLRGRPWRVALSALEDPLAEE
jgi:hypothetical protein